MDNENKTEIEIIELDLALEMDFNKIYDEVKNIGNFFRPETDMTYRVVLTGTKMIPVEKVFNAGTEKEQAVTKYALEVKTINKNKSEFIGVWEVGRGTLRKILDVLKESDKDILETYFRLKKTGTNLDTNYDIMSDEF